MSDTRPAEERADEERASDERAERRRFWRATVIVFGVLAVLVIIITVAAALNPPTKTEQQQAHDRALGQAESLVEPDAGEAPKHSGDPGGWEQLALLGVLVVAVGGGGGYVVYASRKAKRRVSA